MEEPQFKLQNGINSGEMKRMDTGDTMVSKERVLSAAEGLIYEIISSLTDTIGELSNVRCVNISQAVILDRLKITQILERMTIFLVFRLVVQCNDKCTIIIKYKTQ